MDSIPEEEVANFCHGTRTKKDKSKKKYKKKKKIKLSTSKKTKSNDGGSVSKDNNPKELASRQVSDNYDTDTSSNNNCYGCGSTEHGWGWCPVIAKAITSGKFKTDAKVENVKKMNVLVTI